MYPDLCDFVKKSSVPIKNCPDLVWLQKYKICGECPPCCRRAAEREREEIAKVEEKETIRETGNQRGDEGEVAQDLEEKREGKGDDEAEEHLSMAIEKELRKGERGRL